VADGSCDGFLVFDLPQFFIVEHVVFSCTLFRGNVGHGALFGNRPQQFSLASQGAVPAAILLISDRREKGFAVHSQMQQYNTTAQQAGVDEQLPHVTSKVASGSACKRILRRQGGLQNGITLCLSSFSRFGFANLGERVGCA
jgi:hypothetical protein